MVASRSWITLYCVGGGGSRGRNRRFIFRFGFRLLKWVQGSKLIYKKKPLIP